MFKFIKVIQTWENTMHINKLNINTSQPNFKSKYEIDASTAISRNQVFTLGMLMNNFWVRDPRATFNRLKYNSVYGKTVIEVNVNKDKIVERILKKNNIQYKKLDTTV